MKRFLLKPLLGGAASLAACVCTLAEEWPQYRGPAGDGISREQITAWPPNGPKPVWKAQLPGGFSSLSVAEGKVFTVISRNVEGAQLEVCVALAADTGKELWASPTGIAKFEHGGDAGAQGNQGGDGPRSTPAVNSHRVYVYSANMVLHCLDAATGKPVWKKDIAKEFSGRNIGWKSAMSPVIDGNLVYVAGGGAGESMLAFTKTSGAVAWKTGDDTMTHATPVVATIGGVRQIIFLMESGLVALDASNGKSLWRFPFPFRTATGCSPVISGDVIFCTAGYGVGGTACRVTRNGAAFEAKELWRIRGDASVASLWSTPVCKDGYLYGMISYKKFGSGPLKCVDLKTGDVKWEEPGFGAGNLVLAGNHLLALSDDGHVAMVEATPSAYKELGRTKAVEGKCWSTPALSDGRLYIRSTKEGAGLDFSAAQ